MLRIAQLGRGAGNHRLGLLQLGRRIGRATDFAVVAVLVGAAAVGADALDVAVRQEHALGRIVELRHRAAADMAGGLELGVEGFGEFAIDRRIGRIVVIEGHPERGEIALMAGLDVGDEGLWRDARLFGRKHDRRAMGVIGADEPGLVAAQPARAHPDVGLDITDQMAKMQRPIGIGQGGSDECGAGHGGRNAGDT